MISRVLLSYRLRCADFLTLWLIVFLLFGLFVARSHALMSTSRLEPGRTMSLMGTFKAKRPVLMFIPDLLRFSTVFLGYFAV